jgi:hypothetical protein
VNRDMDLIREILIEISGGVIDWDGLDEKKTYHLEMLVEKQYVGGVGVYKAYLRKEGPVRLTFNGHEFLETIREKSVWDKVKNVAKEKGVGLTIESITKIASAVVASILK